MRLILVALAVLVAAGLFLFDAVDRLTNRAGVPPLVSPSALAFHDSLWVADFHNDALLWDRDLEKRSSRGHLDLPRLREGGYRLAVFSAVTAYPAFSNYRRTPASGDLMMFAAIASNWPRDAWLDPYARAHVLARKLHNLEHASNRALRVIRTRDDLRELTAAQARGDSTIGAVLLLEGMHATEHFYLNHIDSLFAVGYRVFGIAHMFDNSIGGSAHGWEKTGLTPLGQGAIARLDSLGAIIDLAHASSATIEEVLALTSRPVVVSHTGLTSNCGGQRNLSDDIVKRIAAKNGLIAIGFWPAAVCGKNVTSVARAIRHAVDVAGADHIALGSDFDGAVRVPFDAAHIASLTSALLDEGLTRVQIRAVMGENQKRFLLAALPAR